MKLTEYSDWWEENELRIWYDENETPTTKNKNSPAVTGPLINSKTKIQDEHKCKPKIDDCPKDRAVASSQFAEHT